jgi:hypothetical protein
MIVVLNGPPGSGKDTIGEALHKAAVEIGMYTWLKSFKHFLYKEAYKLVHKKDLEYDQFLHLCQHRLLKNLPMDLLYGLSPRQFLIHVSEKIIKPTYGSDFFGHKAKKSIEKIKVEQEKLFIFTDGGFESEINVLSSLPDEQILVVHIYRTGCDFSGDSRDYVFPMQSEKVKLVTLKNNSSIEIAVNTLITEIGEFHLKK